MITAALGHPVRQHDDGSRPGMHDLDIDLPDGTVAAVEVTAAADPASIELWNIVNGGDDRWIVPELAGGWMVSLLPSARAKRVKAELPDLLRQLEDAGDVRFGFGWREPGHPRLVALKDLGAVSGSRGDTDFPGVIYLTIELPRERQGGFVSTEASAVGLWLADFLAHPQQADVLAKLARSGADDRHAFVILPGFTTAPFAVSDLLWREDGPLPSSPPVLPAEVTHVWLVSTWNIGTGLRWSPDGGWQHFTKDVPTR